MSEYDLAAPVAPVASSEPQRTPWGFADVVMALGLPTGLLALGLITYIFSGSSDQVLTPSELTVTFVLGMAIEVTILLLAWNFSVRKYHASWADLGLRKPIRGGWLFPLGLVCLAFAVAYSYAILLQVLGVAVEGDIPKEAFDSTLPLILLALLSVGFAPLVEEIFFRGFVFGGLRGRWGTLGAAAGSGVIFGVFHAANPGGFLAVVPPVAVIGAIFAGGYAYSGSLFPTIVAHFLFNLFSFAVGVSVS